MIGDLDWLFPTMIIALAVSVPLALWKIIDIVFWMFKNVSICV